MDFEENTVRIYCPVEDTEDVSVFEDSLFTFLSENEDRLPLQVLCINGGYPSSEHWAEFSDLKIERRNDEEASGTLKIVFTEASPTGCRDITFNEEITATLHFHIDIEKEEIKIWSGYISRKYEKEEF